MGSSGPILIPGADLRYRVASAEHSAAEYVEIGTRTATKIASCLDELGLQQGARLLDFGCGCGRVGQFLNALKPDLRIYGSDIDRPAIDWCRANLSFGRFDVNDADPPLTYEGGCFDAVIALSVFSHLDRARQDRWLLEIARILTPNGIFYLSFSGPYVLETHRNDLPQNNVAEYESQGFTFVRNIGDGVLPDWYQTSLQTPGYLRSALPLELECLSYQERAVNGLQDQMILRKTC